MHQPYRHDTLLRGLLRLVFALMELEPAAAKAPARAATRPKAKPKKKARAKARPAPEAAPETREAVG